MKNNQMKADNPKKNVWKFIRKHCVFFVSIIIAIPLIVATFAIIKSFPLLPQRNEMNAFANHATDVWNTHIPGVKTTVELYDNIPTVIEITDEKISVSCRKYLFKLTGHLENGKVILLPPSYSKMVFCLALLYLITGFLIIIISWLLARILEDCVKCRITKSFNLEKEQKINIV